jgi:hypothetical protein
VIGRRIVRGTRVVLALLVAATLLDASPVRAQDDGDAPTLAGFQGSAAASGLHAFYNPEGILPLPPPVDIGAPDALATIASGPSTFARASVADPGDLLYSPDALLSLFDASYPSGTIPPYPFRIAATSGLGEPVADSNPAPGLSAHVEVGDGSSTARANTPAVDVPAVATFGSMSALATTKTDGSTVTVHSVSRMGNLNVLGLLTIESIITDLTATSSGGETELAGGTSIVGAKVAGQPVTIDDKGVHQAPGTPSLLGGVLAPLFGSVNDLLEQVGVHITVGAPVEMSGGREGQLAASGLRIGLELSRQTLPGLAALLDSIPPIDNPIPGAPSIEDLLVVAQARHLVAIEVGRGVVSLAARTSGAVFTPTDEVPLPSFDGTGSTPTFDLPPVSGPTPTTAPAPVGASESAPIPAGAGVGALVLLALLALPFLGERIAWISTSVLAGDGAESCKWEGR